MDLHCYLVWALNRIKFDEFLDWPFFNENIQSRQQFIFGTKKNLPRMQGKRVHYPNVNEINLFQQFEI